MQRSSFQFEALGTHFEIVTKRPIIEKVKNELLQLVETFDRDFSRFHDDSIVAAMANKKGKYFIPNEAVQLFEFYESLYESTDGKVTPLVGNTLVALGYDAEYTLQEKTANVTPSSIPDYYDVIKRTGNLIEIKEPSLIDVGAAGKGYIVDRIAQLLETHAIDEYLIDASGDMLYKGANVERVGLEDPIHLNRVIGEIELHNKALCASAVNRRKWGNGLHHIIDPVTKRPTQEIIATWVVADSTMIADGLATALFFTEPDLLKNRYNYEYMRVHANGAIDYSPYFKNALYR